LSFPDAPYLGVWTKPGAPFICIEPWHGITDPQGFTGDFRDKPGVFVLAAGELLSTTMGITLLKAEGRVDLGARGARQSPHGASARFSTAAMRTPAFSSCSAASFTAAVSYSGVKATVPWSSQVGRDVNEYTSLRPSSKDSIAHALASPCPQAMNSPGVIRASSSAAMAGGRVPQRLHRPHVPIGMQIGVVPIRRRREADAVAAMIIVIRGMQRLVQIADEMDQELQGHEALRGTRGRIPAVRPRTR
jgi:hypothetical protein